MRRLLQVRWPLVIVLCFLLVPALVLAQTETGAINGTVTDPSGAIIPNATVVVKNVATNAVRNAATNSEGIYAVTNLPPGTYLVSVEQSGFNTLQKSVDLGVGARAGIDFQLQVGKTGTVMEISAAALTVNTETQTLGATITTELVTELPSINRDPYAFVGTVGVFPAPLRTAGASATPSMASAPLLPTCCWTARRITTNSAPVSANMFRSIRFRNSVS